MHYGTQLLLIDLALFWRTADTLARRRESSMTARPFLLISADTNLSTVERVSLATSFNEVVQRVLEIVSSGDVGVILVFLSWDRESTYYCNRHKDSLTFTQMAPMMTGAPIGTKRLEEEERAC